MHTNMHTQTYIKSGWAPTIAQEISGYAPVLQPHHLYQ